MKTESSRTIEEFTEGKRKKLTTIYEAAEYFVITETGHNFLQDRSKENSYIREARCVVAGF
ncbi:MAG: hypothetical protein JEY99_02355 [Spirochaetales bacterium]|nr:hypothetical protein [Spirochaetales bacterium]